MRNHFILYGVLAAGTKAFSFHQQGAKGIRSHIVCDQIKLDFKLQATRRTFLSEKIVAPAAALVAFTLAPENSIAAEEEGDLFKGAQARMEARTAARKASRDAKEQAKQNNEDNESFAIADKVQEIQEGIQKRKEQAILFDKQETKRMEENEFIKELQARSASNKERYKQEATRTDKLSPNQFRDQYKKRSYTGVRTSDGSTKMFLAEEVEELEKAGRIKIDYEIGLTKDGTEFVDRSKRILVLID